MPPPWRATENEALREGRAGKSLRFLRSLELFLEFPRPIEGFTGSELVQLEELADLDFALTARAGTRGAHGPLDRLLARLDVDDPVAADQLLGLGKGPVDQGPVAAGEADARALRA